LNLRANYGFATDCQGEGAAHPLFSENPEGCSSGRSGWIVCWSNEMTKTLRILFALATLISVTGSIDAAFAKPKLSTYGINGRQLTLKQYDGLKACYQWCVDHNKTTKSQVECSANCDSYWSTNQG
jgi:hypothetical protein